MIDPSFHHFSLRFTATVFPMQHNAVMRRDDLDEEERRVGRPGKLSLTLSLFLSFFLEIDFM